MASEKSSTDFDVIIVGAGISGINAAYRIQESLPNYKYTLLESRGGIGGTWDLFKYPGIRSDSDLHTFGFPWAPWTQAKSIADGVSIVEYIKSSAARYGIEKHVEFYHKMLDGNWSSDIQRWKISIDANGTKKQYTGRFVIMSTGYYDYEEALPAQIPGLSNFKGQTIHPQFWPSDFNCDNKKVIIIGSGATAVTLLPNLAKAASHVTMLQRSPGYLISLPQTDPAKSLLGRLLPTSWLHRLTRFQFLVLPWLFFKFCRSFPNAARNIMKKRTEPQLPKNVPHDPHFNPKYNPWEQRLCVCPDGDFFKCLHEGVASVATGHIKTVTQDGIELEDGQKLTADIIVTATGLKIQMAGGSKISVDGERIVLGEKFIWKGDMIQDMPNAAFVVGYTNASWTLGADATAQHMVRLFKYMDTHRYTSATPRVHDPNMAATPLLNLNSTYVKKAVGSMPKGGSVGPWKPRSNYFQDIWNAKFGNVTTDIEFKSVST